MTFASTDSNTYCYYSYDDEDDDCYNYCCHKKTAAKLPSALSEPNLNQEVQLELLRTSILWFKWYNLAKGMR